VGFAAELYKEAITPDPELIIWQWADQYRYLPKESSAEPGRYRTSRVPYFREVMYELSPVSPTTEIVFIKPTQIGATEIGNNFLFATAHRAPGPSLFVLPTDHMATKHSKKKITPSIRHTPALKDLIKEPKSRDSGNTILVKEFPGGSWTFTGSNSPAAARSDSIRYLVLDDVDGFIPDVGGEGDPIDLYRKRTDAFGSRKKIYINSTPTLKGFSNIERAYESSSQGLYCVPCPFCGFLQFLEWCGKGFEYGIKFEHNTYNEITAIWYVCKQCHGKIEESHKTAMLDAGCYVHTFPERKRRGFKINALYSPLGWLSWAEIAEEFLNIKGNKEKLKVWVNTRQADTFEEKGDQPEWAKLKARCEQYSIATVPMGGLILSAGVDVQENRLEVAVKAWGRGDETWLVLFAKIYGDPRQQAVWNELDMILNNQYPHASGTELQILSMAVDAGYATQEVYNYARSRKIKVIAVKGSSETGRPVLGKPKPQDVSWQGKTIKKGVNLWMVGTDTAKKTIYERLALSDPGPGYFHFPIGMDDEYFLQLTAEKLVTRYVKGFPVQEFVKMRERNEALDCEVYAYAAALRAGLSFINWDAIEKSIGIGGVATAPNPAQIKRPPLPERPDRLGYLPKIDSKKWFGR